LNLLLNHPRKALVVMFGVLAFFAYHSRDFKLDASADSLLIEDDPDLQLSRQISARYESRESLIVTFTPHGILFEDESLQRLTQLRDELIGVVGVDSVMSILDVPLVTSSDIPLLEMVDNIQTLESPTIDRRRAIDELTNSPVFENLIISRDKLTTAILVNLEPDERFTALQATRNELLIQRSAGGLGPEQVAELAEVTLAYEQASDVLSDRHHRTVEAVRSVLFGYQPYADLRLGGFPMIADDMVKFVKKDLMVFGSCVLVFLIFVLTLIFRQLRWVVLPLFSCFYAIVIMVGVLGLVGWDVTVISSNFLALMLIITISINMHLAVRYNELLAKANGEGQVQLVSMTVRKMTRPCLYTAMTTIIGFCSLVFSEIKPVQDFGWMMSIGLGVAFATSFTLFPVVLVLLEPKRERTQREEVRLTALLADLTERHGGAILVGAIVLAAISATGISRLTVENSFIDYFREDTEIYQGMKLIDDKLGGTTPLQVLINFDSPNDPVFLDEEDEFDDEFDIDGWGDEEEDDPAAYWFTPSKIEKIKRVHDYLDGFPEIGKVLSLASLIRVAEGLNDGNPFDGLELSLLYKKLPDEIKGPLIEPYVSIENNEARILLRILDSQDGLRRNELLERIHTGFRDELQFGDHEVKVAGTLVLYNKMLQSLFASQMSSLAAVMTGIAAMFLILFRSARLAVIGLVPNVLAAAIVLGFLGLAGIPLDMMTITIAAITIGIAVDDGIHYIYRFREEFSKSGDYVETLHTCHASVGRAVFYTSVTVIFGFSILMFSNFMPTIYFGVSIGLAMLFAFLAALTLLPKLILIWKPFGPEFRVESPPD
jgi:predicted RND superfamily exporter protein